MTRDEAIEHARKHAKAQPESYYVEPFQPHEWVIGAIMAASAIAKTKAKGTPFTEAERRALDRGISVKMD